MWILVLVVLYVLCGAYTLFVRIQRRRLDHARLIEAAGSIEDKSPRDDHHVPARWLHYHGLGLFDTLVTLMFWPIVVMAGDGDGEHDHGHGGDDNEHEVE